MTQWISHRGESADAPENTLPAYLLAGERDTDGFELDIHLTEDGKLVCIHDSDTWRTCQGISRIVENTSFDDLEKLDASYMKNGFDGVKIPLFSDALKCLKPGKVCFVEIKENNPAVIDAMIEVEREAGISPERIVMISFHSEIVRIFKQRFPERTALFLASSLCNEGGIREDRMEELFRTACEIKADGVDIFLAPQFISREFVRRIHDAGLKCAVWTVDQASAAKSWKDAGADAITSNCAAKVREWVRTHPNG